MITLRMLGIAVAILVGIPLSFAIAHHAIGHVQVPGGEIVEMTADMAATVTDIVLIEPPPTYDRAVVHNAPEQLVEGHTVFVTWDIPLIPNVTNWTLDIIGDIDCKVHQNTSGVYWGGIPIPTRINEAHAECHAGGFVFVTPDPFYDSEETYSAPAYSTQLEPTGNFITFTAPHGVQGEATEYRYHLVTEDWMGVQTTHTRYAWSVPVIEEWTHRDGGRKTWYAPLPVERLLEMGLTQFTAYHEDELPSYLRLE